jgi:hypothetical protein
MRLIAIAAMVALRGVVAHASENAGTQGGRTVAVCMEANVRSDVAIRAQWLASKMFAGIGVTLDWQHGLRGCASQGIEITLGNRTPANFKPAALAYALPYEGTHIHVFYDRIAHYDGSMVPAVLAHVLVHEITHVLEGLICHSASGIMKAHWDQIDFQRMAYKPLNFETEDIDLIYRGLTARVARQAVAMNAKAVSVAAP